MKFLRLNKKLLNEILKIGAFNFFGFTKCTYLFMYYYTTAMHMLLKLYNYIRYMHNQLHMYVYHSRILLHFIWILVKVETALDNFLPMAPY